MEILRCALVVGLVVSLLGLATGCDATCTAACDDQYADCVDRAPPGASKQDCDAEYDRCLAQCDASQQ